MYAIPIGLNMGYYHILITEDASKLCIIILSYGNTITNIQQ